MCAVEYNAIFISWTTLLRMNKLLCLDISCVWNVPLLIAVVTLGPFTVGFGTFTTGNVFGVWPRFPKPNFPWAFSMDTSKRTKGKPMTVPEQVSSGFLFPTVNGPIREEWGNQYIKNQHFTDTRRLLSRNELDNRCEYSSISELSAFIRLKMRKPRFLSILKDHLYLLSQMPANRCTLRVPSQRR